jgi:hypothetical protein
VGRAQVWFYRTNRINDGAARASAATEQVRERNGVGVKELTEDHPASPVAAIAGLITVHSINIVIDP